MVEELVELLKQKVSKKELTNEQIAQTFYLVITEIFEKACFENKFVDLYAKVLIKITEQTQLDMDCFRKVDLAIKQYSKDNENILEWSDLNKYIGSASDEDVSLFAP